MSTTPTPSPSDPDVTVLAHAVGIRQDLPAELWIVMTAGALVLVVSFVALGTLWKQPRLRGGLAGLPLPRLQAVVDHPVVVWVLRLLVLAVSVLVVFVALLGPDETSFNLAPYALYVTFWVGLVPVSLLFGAVWRKVNPLRTLYLLLRMISGPAPAEDGAVRFGLYPAVAFVLAFTWLELVYPDRALPQTVGVVILVYAVVQLVAAMWFGESWFEHGDAFEVWSTLLGRLAPFGRRDDGALVLRSPLDGADGTPAAPGLAAFVIVMVGSTGFDGVTRAQWWQNHFLLSGRAQLVPTTGLLLTVGLVAVLYLTATALAGLISDRATPPPPPPRPKARKGGPTPKRRPEPATLQVHGWERIKVQPVTYAHSVIPIAAGYAIAHYFSLFVLEGQLTWILASNPFARDGVDLFGTYRNEVDLTVVSPRTISLVSILGIVVGHVVGVILAHDRAVRENRSARTAALSQLPLLVMMVLFTLGGLALLLG